MSTTGIHWSILASALLVAACAEDESSASSDTAPKVVGCERALALVLDGGCMFEWICSDGGAHVLTCADLDGGLSCACAVGAGEPEGMPSSAPASACQDTTGRETARSVCGWPIE